MSGGRPDRIRVYRGGSISCILHSIDANHMNPYVDSVEMIQFADDPWLVVTGKITNLTEMIATLERARAVSDSVCVLTSGDLCISDRRARRQSSAG